MRYDVTFLNLRPHVQPRALETLKASLAGAPGLLACWYAEIGALNRIMIVRDAAAAAGAAEKTLAEENPFELADALVSIECDTFVSFPFVPAMRAGEQGPFFEVRTYLLKAGALGGTLTRWEKALPERIKRSPILAAMHSVTGVAPRFIHVWPYKSLDDRQRIRAAAVADQVWPPPGGGDSLATMRSEIYLPATFSPIR